MHATNGFQHGRRSVGKAKVIIHENAKSRLRPKDGRIDDAPSPPEGEDNTGVLIYNYYFEAFYLKKTLGKENAGHPSVGANSLYCPA